MAAHAERSQEQTERTRVAYWRMQYPWIQFDPPQAEEDQCPVCKGKGVLRKVQDLPLQRGQQVVQLASHTLTKCPVCSGE